MPVCRWCKETFPTWSGLGRHARDAHGRMGIKPDRSRPLKMSRCPECARPAPLRSRAKVGNLDPLKFRQHICPHGAICPIGMSVKNEIARATAGMGVSPCERCRRIRLREDAD